ELVHRSGFDRAKTLSAATYRMPERFNRGFWEVRSNLPANGPLASPFRRARSSTTNFKSFDRIHTAKDKFCSSLRNVSSARWLPKIDLTKRPSGNSTAVASKVWSTEATT